MSLPIRRIRELLAPTYTIDRELGRGGMATVCLAQDTKHERVVALKVVHPGLAESLGAERFLREIKVVARLNHPHILPLFDSGEVEGFLYYVMPYVEGESLRERLERENQLPIDEAIRHTFSIASALDYAHRQNVVHRDVKPENVMMYEGEAMVMDFGIAKSVIESGERSVTQSGALFGTPAYVSPEQAAGAGHVDGRADQYSLGVVLYEMLAGERPFSGDTDVEAFAKRFKETPTPIRQLREGVPESVETALTKAMSPDPNARYDTIAQFARAMGSGAVASPIVIPTTPRPTVSAAKSVAVLPFTNMSADADNEYFADGIAEEIINALTKVQSLRVASRTSSFAFKGKNEVIGEIGRKLKVSTVLEGSVRKMGNKLRITAQLINVADGYHLWAEQYDREMQDIFAIQEDISQAIVKSLRVILSEGEKLAMGKVRTVDINAYDYYLRGRKFFHQHRRKSLEYAVQIFEKAIEIDSSYPLAYAAIAVASSLLYTYFDRRAVNSIQADVASRKALELAPDLAEAHLARAIALRLGEHAGEADHEFEEAIRLDPKLFDAFYFYGRARKYQGRYAESAKLLERASQLRPEDFQAPAFLGGAYAGMGMRAEATAARRRAVKLIEQRLDLNPDDARAYNLGATTLAKLGNIPRALEFAAKSLSIEPDDPLVLYNVACLHALTDKREEALGYLERAVTNGFGHRESMANDPDLDSIRKTPWFQAIAKAMFILLLLVGCRGDSVGPAASLAVITQTQGGVVDADGFTVQVGSSGAATVGANASVTIDNVRTGAQTVSLGGIAPNCSVTGENPRTVQIRSGENPSVTFQVVCTALPGGSYRIAFMATHDDPNAFPGWEIYSMNSDGSVVRLTNNNFFDGYPTWSPNGQKIVFGSDRDGNLEIYVMNQDGTNVIRLTNTAANVVDRFPSWSPDGSKILFLSNRDGDSEVFVMNADGSNVTQLTSNTFAESFPQFSPDGSKIVFTSNRDAPDPLPPFGKWEVYEMNADGTGQTRLTSFGAISDRPSYFKNGTKILFDSNRLGFFDIYVMNVDGTGLTRLTNTLSTNYLAVGSPDQSHIIFTNASSFTHAEVYVMRDDGTGVDALTHTPDNVTNIGYSYRK